MTRTQPASETVLARRAAAAASDSELEHVGLSCDDSDYDRDNTEKNLKAGPDKLRSQSACDRDHWPAAASRPNRRSRDSDSDGSRSDHDPGDSKCRQCRAPVTRRAREPPGLAGTVTVTVTVPVPVGRRRATPADDGPPRLEP